MGNTLDIGTAVSGAYYGSTAGVQDIVKVTTFTATSMVTLTDVTEELTSTSSVIDMRLDAIGHTTPVTTSAALDILSRCANLLCAATTYERLLEAADPSPERMGSVKAWRDEATAILDGIYDGSVPLPGLSAPATGSAPYVASAGTTAFPRDHTDDFIDAYGSNFAGGGSSD